MAVVSLEGGGMVRRWALVRQDIRKGWECDLVILRKRRTKLKVDQFHIIAQVGQGGYGEVYLARKQVCLATLGRIAYSWT